MTKEDIAKARTAAIEEKHKKKIRRIVQVLVTLVLFLIEGVIYWEHSTDSAWRFTAITTTVVGLVILWYPHRD